MLFKFKSVWSKQPIANVSHNVIEPCLPRAGDIESMLQCNKITFHQMKYKEHTAWEECSINTQWKIRTAEHTNVAICIMRQ